MAQKIIQTQTTAQVQQLSLAQVALSQMVELPLAQFAERVQNEMIDNEALEEADNERDAALDAADPSADSSNGGDDEVMDGGDASEISVALGDYSSEDEVPDYLRERAERAETGSEFVVADQGSFYEELQRQIGEHNLTDHESEVMDYLIGSLDSDGFLRKDALTIADELAIYHNIYTDAAEVDRLLALLQTFEPRGIGARSLQECLRLQLTDPDNHSPWRKDALAVIDTCYQEFAANHWDEVVRRMDFDDEQASHVRHELLHLNPAPGRAFGESSMESAPTVTPDFFVQIGPDGTATATLNWGDVPPLRVSQAFMDSIQQYTNHSGTLTREQQEAYVYAQGKVKAAQGFLLLINRRRQTLMAVMQGILDIQRAFFEGDDDEALLRPMALKDVAARAGVDISTVSRTVTAKYVQTLYGVYPLKHFFSGQFTSADGEEVSARQVRAALTEIINQEDKQSPLSDEALVKALQARGLQVARRTVAKYRDALHIPVARYRRQASSK